MKETAKIFGELLVTTVAVMATIVLIKLAANQFLPSNGAAGAAKGLINVV